MTIYNIKGDIMMTHMKLIMENWNRFVKSEQLITEQQKNKACLMLESLYEEGVITEGLKDSITKMIKSQAPKITALGLALATLFGATAPAAASVIAPVDEPGIEDVVQDTNYLEIQDNQVVFSDDGARAVVVFFVGELMNSEDLQQLVRDGGGIQRVRAEVSGFLEVADSGEPVQLNQQDFPFITFAMETLASSLQGAATAGIDVEDIEDFIPGAQENFDRAFRVLAGQGPLGQRLEMRLR